MKIDEATIGIFSGLFSSIVAWLVFKKSISDQNLVEAKRNENRFTKVEVILDSVILRLDQMQISISDLQDTENEIENFLRQSSSENLIKNNLSEKVHRLIIDVQSMKNEMKIDRLKFETIEEDLLSLSENLKKVIATVDEIFYALNDHK